MISRPGVDATVLEIEQYIRAWVKTAANEGFEAALSYIDPNPNVPWSNELLDELTFNQFHDGQHCRITDPDRVADLKVAVFPYIDGSGYALDHDLAMNEKLSEFTAQFDIRKGERELIVILHDIHVL